jgi:hypothetical protein
MIRDHRETGSVESLYREYFEAPAWRAKSNGHSPPAGRASERSDAEVIEKARAERNGKFDRLWNGDTSDYGYDHSDADDGFVHKLWPYTQDEEQIRRIHAASGLHRADKSGRRQEYLNYSFVRARENTDWFYEWEPPTLSLNGSGGRGEPGRAPDGAELLERLAWFIRRYVALSEEQALLIALWVVHTHTLDAADTTPYLNVKSAEKRSGKTRLLEVLSLLAAGSWLTGRVTAAVLVRKVAAVAPALLLDESDAAFKGEREYAETLRGVLNAGFRRGGVASLCVGQGANITYEDFPVYCPKVIAGIGKLPDTVADRSIPIELRRRRPSEKVERFRLRKVGPEALPIFHDVRAWAQAHLDSLSGAEPDLPDELDDRAQDIMEPLLAIADEVGGEWPERSRRAAVGLLTGEEREDAESLGVRLLRDVQGVFDDKSSDRLPTGKLLEALHAMEEAPWGSLRGEALDARGLARLLKLYGVKPEKLREGDDTFRGYRRASFEDAWARYLSSPPGEAEHAEHSEHSADRAGSDVPHEQNVPEHGGYVEHERAHKKGDVPHVPDVPHNPVPGKRPLVDRRDVEAAGAQMRRAKSGPALALRTYLEKPSTERLEWLTRAVLTAREIDPKDWRGHAAAVKAAAEGPANHPLDCECEACL